MNRIEEFWYCVASQDDLPIYKNGIKKTASCNNLVSLVNSYKKNKQKQDVKTDKDIISKMLLEKPQVISDMRTLVGVSDKRLYLDLTYITSFYKGKNNLRFVSEPREKLIKHDTKFFIRLLLSSPMRCLLADKISEYLIKRGLIEILDTFSSLGINQIEQIFNNLIATKEIQQMQAKYRGHGAEQAFAKIVSSCGVEIIPVNKDTNPMADHDPNVDLSTMNIVQRNASDKKCHSFDLVIKQRARIRVLIQSLIHSSDPGQFGVNKSEETIDISKIILEFNNNVEKNQQVFLLGSVDGVGFCENPNGTLVKMLDVFDDFFQIHTLFKIPVFLQKIGIINNIEGIVFDENFFEEYAIKHFEDNYLLPASIKRLSIADLKNKKTLQAGKAIVVFRDL